MMITLKKAMEITGMPYAFLRQLCLDNKVKFVRSGSKFYINKSSLLEFLGVE